MNYNMMPVAYAVIADPFAKSPYNPVNMSRTASKKSSGHAPSARILERVREAAADLAHLATTQQGWKFVTEKNRAMVYEMNGRALPPTVSTVHTFGAGGGHISDFYLVRAVTTVHANIPAVLDALQARTTEEFAPKMKKIFGKHYKQGVVVNELSCTTPPPFALDPDSTSGARKSFSEDDAYSVNWLSLQSGSSDKSRDFTMVCYQDGFERQDRTLTRIGRGAVHDRTLKPNSSSLGASQGPGANAAAAPKLLGVHVFSSVNFKDIPALPSNQHSDRQHFRNSGFVVEATNDPHAFKLSLFLSLLPTKSSLKHARKYQKWLLSLVSIVSNVASAVQIVAPELNLSHLGKTAWKKSDHCYICLKMFRTFRRCHHCRLCGEAVCSTCSGFVKVSMSRGRSNSQSSVDMRSGYSYDDAGSSSGDDSSSYQNETRGCTVCIQSISQNGSVVGRKSSRSSSSFSSNSQAIVNSSSAMSVSARSEDESSISFGDDSSDFGGSASHGAGQNSFQQSYYDHRKRSTNSSSDDNQSSSAATNPLAASSSSVNMKQHQFNNSDYHHNMMNTPSMSTTSSSFSRTSHEAELMMMQQHPALQSSSNQDQYAPQHQPRNYMQSFSSEVSYGNDDLSLDPDILALAGLTLKPTVSSHSSNSSGSNHGYAQQQQVLTVAEEDYDDFDPAASQRSASGGPRCWSATDSVASSNNSAAAAPARAPPARPQQPQEGSGGSTFHFSVMSNSSNSNSNNTSSSLPAPPKSSVHAEIAALMLEDLATPSSSVSSQVGGPYGKPPTSSSSSLSASMRLPASAPPQQQPQADARFHMSATSYSPFGANGNAAMGMSRGFNPSASAGSNSSHNPQFSSSKIISMATLTASQQQQQQQRSLLTASSNERANDMILLSAPAPKSPEFVCFEDSQRESIFVRPGDGSDMIPLNLAGGRF